MSNFSSLPIVVPRFSRGLHQVM